MFRLLFAFVFSAAAPSLAQAAGPPQLPSSVTFQIEPAPGWVMPVKADYSVKDADEGGISYLLIDRQDNVALQSSYYHEAHRLTSENGVQNGASVTASFDPSYQKLIFHAIHVTRNGTRLDRLERANIRLLQREKDMESFLYDGAYTAQCEIEDVRIGDVIEYSYTIVGMNPVKAARYDRVFWTDWNTRVHRVITRLLFPMERKIQFRTTNRPLKPSIITEKGITVWLHDETNVPGRRTDRDVPRDYEPNSFVQFSEFQSWREVVDWALPLFTISDPASPELRDQVEQLRKITGTEERILAALHVVEDEVRYLGIESGPSSHRPTAPSEVFRRRFGDCKDKALLLATILQQCGVDAAPALVATGYRKTVAERLPAPEDFDHAIVQVKIGGNLHWLDPTRSRQRGPLSELYVRDLGFALVLRAGTDSLTAYSPPPGSLPRRVVTENYIVPEPGKTGELEVVTESFGLSAERTRSAFQEDGREEIEKEYLQYYTRLFPKAVVKKPLVYEEIKGHNGCRTREFYSIPEIWTMNEETDRYELFLNPGDVADAMGKAGPSQRDDPLAINYPANVSQVIHARMFDTWSIGAKKQNVTNAFFRFTEDPRVKGRDVELAFSFEALTDRVMPRDLPAYNAALSKFRDNLGYTLFYRKPAVTPGFSKWMDRFNWSLAAITLVVAGLLFATGLVYFFVTKRAEPLALPADALPQWTGIGGWLLLVAIHHIVRPCFYIVTIIQLCPVLFNLETWHSFVRTEGANYHPYWAPVLLTEFFGNLICLAAACLLLLLFFRKRAAWPRTYAAFLLFVAALVAFDFWLAQKVPVVSKAGAVENTRDLTRAIAAAAIWVPYCFVSKRVKATFRK